MEKDMETIKVYESYWKSDTDLAWSLTICIWAVYAILKSGYEYSGMILLGMFGFFVVINILKRIWRKPRLIVYDSAVKVNTSEPWSVLFNDVESFYPTRYNGQDVIGVRYKQGTELWKPEDEILDSRKSRVRYPENLHPGKPYEIYANGLEMKGQQLCDLLNQRLDR